MDNLSLNQLKDVKEIVDCLIDHSQSSIIRTNFVEAFYKYSIADEEKHTLYGNIKLFGAKSFRITSNHPNLNNFPATGSLYARAVKKCFKAKKGRIFYIVDLAA